MKKILGLLTLIAGGSAYLLSCYNNKYDVNELPQVSFVKEVVPIMTSGACGCHNLGATNITQFSHKDTIFYDAILARATMLGDWANNKIPHPGGGNVYLSPSERTIISTWVAQGAKSDYVAPNVSGNVTYSGNMVPLINSTCSGGSCHGTGAAGGTLSYATLTTSQNITRLTQMANSGGSSGHPGGSISLSNNATSTILAWIAQGTKP